MTRSRVEAVALLSGICGIAYEILFMRLLSTFLGELFYVGAAVLASFLLAFGFGALHAWRLVRHLWLFEMAIGAYAALIALISFADPLRTWEVLAPVAGKGVLPLTALVFGLLALPAALIGFSVPMFTLYASRDARAPSKGFDAVYAFYNLGAAGCVLLLEYLLLRALGIRATILLLACINLAIGLLVRRLPKPEPAARGAGARIPLRPISALALASFASGIWQLLTLKIAEQVFGPFHENFSLTVALGLIGISSGTLLAARTRIPASWWMGGCALAMMLSFGAVNPTVALWSALNGTLGGIPGIAPVLKLFVLALLAGVPLVALGAAIPVTLRTLPHDGAPVAGRLVAISSFANVAGYLAMMFVLHEHLEYRQIVTLTAALSAAAGVLFLGPAFRGAGAVAAAATIAVLAVWLPSRSYLEYGFSFLRSGALLRTMTERLSAVETVKRFDNRVDILRTRDGLEMVNINGYHSLAMTEGGRRNLRELVFGLVPALYAPASGHALVLGLGTGMTAGATASVFRRTTAVEINPALFSLLPRFSAYNLDVARNPSVELVLKDAITVLTESDRRYDAIINTVTSPLYFSSAKLYTREFFALAASRLNPGGIYALWFDARVAEAGARILFETLRQSFADCHLVYIASGYLQVICAQHRLAPRPLEPGRLGARLEAILREEAPGLDPSTFLLSLVLPRNGLHAAPWAAPANSLEHPALEFLMSGLALVEMESPRLLRLAGVDLGRSGLKAGPLDREELALRCYALRVLAVSGDCVAELRARYGGGLPRAYTKRVLDLLARAPVPASDRQEALTLLEQVIVEGQPADASFIEDWLRRLEPAVIDSPGDLRDRYLVTLLRAKQRLRRGQPVPEDLATRLAAFHPLAPSTLEILAYVTARQGDARATAYRLELLRRQGIPTQELARIRGTIQSIGGRR